MKTFSPYQKSLYLLCDHCYWAAQRPPGTTSCL